MSVAKICARGTALRRSHMFAHQNSDRKDFLASGAAGRPDAYDVIGAAALEQLRDNSGRQRLERLFVAKEIRDIDQQAPEEFPDLRRLLPQPLHVTVDRLELGDLHAPLYATQEVPSSYSR